MMRATSLTRPTAINDHRGHPGAGYAGDYAVGGEPNGGYITDTTPTVGGTGVNGETVIVYNNGVEVGRVVVANGNGT